ncbi:MAG TPA: DUF502 domain-containing protein, partial [Chitinophagaceae bacterium]|nr:DUF502 domain-containing protein [Chitinophagaceae bacterium]
MKLMLKKYFKILLQFFLQGVVVLAPIGITVWVIVSLFNVIDDLLPNLLSNVFPNYIKKDINGNFEKITGLGFVMVIMLVLFVGWLSSLLQIGKALNIFDKVLENTPGIKIIYSSVKDFF